MSPTEEIMTQPKENVRVKKSKAGSLKIGTESFCKVAESLKKNDSAAKKYDSGAINMLQAHFMTLLQKVTLFCLSQKFRMWRSHGKMYGVVDISGGVI
jgi:hypothetical protein